MRRLTLCILVAIPLCLCAWALSGCGSDTDTDPDNGGNGNGGDPVTGATVSGQVVSLGEIPIVGATVTLGSQSTNTDSNGSFSFADVPLGTHLFTVSHPGYMSVPAVSVTVEEGANNLGAVRMTTSGDGPPPPPPI